MTQLQQLTPAQVLLLATQLATESDLPRFQVLAATRKDVLDAITVYRLLLTFLPVDIESHSLLTTFLQHVLHNFDGISELDLAIDISSVEGIPKSQIDRSIQELRLNSITEGGSESESDPVSQFLKQWTYRSEATTGLSNAHIQLVDAFCDGRPQLRQWRNSCLLPLCRLQNDFYPGEADRLNLGAIEHTYGQAGVRLLLQFAENAGKQSEIGRDLTEVVTPWVQGSRSNKRRKMSNETSRADTDWDDVYNWIYTISGNLFALAAKAIMEWYGPPQASAEEQSLDSVSQPDPYLQYGRAILAVILNSPSKGSQGDARLKDLLQKGIETTLRGQMLGHKADSLETATKIHLLHNKLYTQGNPITSPSDETFQFISNCIETQDALEFFRLNLPISSIAEISLFGSEERQKQELGRILTQIPKLTAYEQGWAETRAQVLKLHSGEDTEPSGHRSFRFLGRVPRDYIESEILTTVLAASEYSTIFNIYLGSAEPPLDKSAVKNKIIAAIFDAYDNATNGNRTRGGMKKASDLSRTFQTAFPDESTFKRIDLLIKATHSLSFYQLTLEHGVPFQPVNIRLQHDPLSLIEKVLEQNPKAFTKLDDLIDIGRNLVNSDLTESPSAQIFTTSLEERTFEAVHRITFLAITSALNDHDFDTAYSYITTRLLTTPSQAVSAPFTDGISWRAAYAAGKYRPLTPAKSVHERITSLSKRMDLLSLALTLAPDAEPLSEILATWRRCEEEMDSLRSQALDEERSIDLGANLGTSALPGGFAPEGRELDAAETRRMQDRRANAGFSPTYEDQAPMGLFDVARGAASAFRKSAFPLTGAGRQDGGVKLVGGNLPTGQQSPMTQNWENGDEMATDAQRTRRKRDVVSGIVTGGLVSGMSWVLGAQPTNQREGQEHD